MSHKSLDGLFIQPWMINILSLPNKLQEVGVHRYMEYPEKNSERRFVIQSHIRGESQHMDFRMEVNDHLNGWSIVGGSTSDPVTPEKMNTNRNKGYRAETKCYSVHCNEWMYDIEENSDGTFTANYKVELESLSYDEGLEELARQPKTWLKVKGDIKPGKVGAGIEAPGRFEILASGHYWEGTQKPYFHEYFIKGGPFDKFTRIIFRGVRVARIDPDTKKPIKGQYEMLWRCMIPGDQTAYALKRGVKKGWKPPKDIIPIPPDQRKGELWDKWQEYMKTKTPSKEKEEEGFTHRDCFKFATCKDPDTLANPDGPACKGFILSEELAKELEQLPFADYKNFDDCVEKIMAKKGLDKKRASAYCAFIARRTGELAKARFTLHMNSWMGPVHVRGIPEKEWYLRIDAGDGIRSWVMTEGDPVYESPQPMNYEGKVSKKWMDFEGVIKPGKTYNPNKELDAKMIIEDNGTVDWDSKIENGVETIHAKFHGKKLKGEWEIVQEEKGQDTFTMEKLSMEELLKTEFVLHRHYWDEKEHWDLRWKVSDDHKQEINIMNDPLGLKEEEPVQAIFKDIEETPEEVKYWMITEGTKIERKVGELVTYVDVLDHGDITIIEQSPEFISMNVNGEKFKGYFVAKKVEKGWIFQKAALPKAQTLAGGDPTSGPYRPFIKKQKKGWDYYWLYLYDMKGFSRCVEDHKKYLPDLTLPGYIEEISVCLYPRPGTVHGARVAALKVDAETDQKTVDSWIKKEKLDTWEGELIREGKEEKCSPCQELKPDILEVILEEEDNGEE